MLFDLQGKRRRVVQATYLTLAILMGGGLVLFGIGSDVQGGLADFFTGGDTGGQSGDQVIEDQLAEAEAQLEANPKDPQALATVARTNVQLATTTDPEARSAGQLFAPEETGRLEGASDAWERYADVASKPDDALAFLMTQVYGPQGLNEPAKAVDAARVVAEARRTPEAYLVVAQYAALAGDKQEVDTATKRAVELAPKSRAADIEQQVKAIQAAATAAGQEEGGQPGAAGATVPEGLELPQGGAEAPGAPAGGETDTGSPP
jgi:hypothetical protein